MSDLLSAVAKCMGATVSKRFFDLAYKQKAEETRTPEEIINTISEKLKKLGEGGK